MGIMEKDKEANVFSEIPQQINIWGVLTIASSLSCTRAMRWWTGYKRSVGLLRYGHHISVDNKTEKVIKSWAIPWNSHRQKYICSVAHVEYDLPRHIQRVTVDYCHVVELLIHQLNQLHKRRLHELATNINKTCFYHTKKHTQKYPSINGDKVKRNIQASDNPPITISNHCSQPFYWQTSSASVLNLCFLWLPSKQFSLQYYSK